MSIRAMSIVWTHFPRGGSEKLALLALADWCDDDGGRLYPSISAIATRICVSPSQARRLVHGLIEKGLLEVVGGHHGGPPGATRRYRLNLAAIESMTDSGATPTAETASTDATPRMDATPRTHARDGLHPCARRLAPVQANTSVTVREPSIGPRSSRGSRLDVTTLPDDWRAFCETKRPDLDADETFAEFVDYWVAQPGSRGVKADWSATWRNWVRRQHGSAQTRSGRPSDSPWAGAA